MGLSFVGQLLFPFQILTQRNYADSFYFVLEINGIPFASKIIRNNVSMVIFHSI